MNYEIVKAVRFFDKDRLYVDINWFRFDQVVDAFRKRIQDWYLDPAHELAKNGHFAFAVMALNCLLIDTLSQFVHGRTSSAAIAFKQFLRDYLPNYAVGLTVPITHYDGKTTQLGDVADVLYHGFRCGILHQAHVTPYGLIDPGQKQAVQIEPSGYVKYAASNADCPSVTINPLMLLTDLSTVFQDYVQDLNRHDPKHDQLRANFKVKFSSAFGVDVSSAT